MAKVDIIVALCLLQLLFIDVVLANSWTGGSSSGLTALLRGGGLSRKKNTVKTIRRQKRKRVISAESLGDKLKQAVMESKVSPDTVIVGDTLNEHDPSAIYLSAEKMEELELFQGDTVVVRGKKRRQTVSCAYRDTTLKNAEVRLCKSQRDDIRIRLGDVVHIKHEPNVKYASAVKLAVFEESLSKYHGSVAEKAKPMEGEVLEQKIVAPHFKGKFRPLQKGSVISIQGIEFKVLDLITDDVKGEDTRCIVSDETTFYIDSEPISREDDERLSEVGYEDIGGCSKQISDIRELVELPLRHPKIFESIGIPPPKGVLMHGPPGSGKTSMAKAVAAESGAFFFLINGPEIMSKLAGESENNLRKAFEAAEKNAPSILFIDEIDSIATSREKAGGEMERRMVSQLLTLMDGLKDDSNVVVMAATNRPGVLDTALRRFGRFDREIDIGVPDDKGRIEILKIKTRDMKLSKEVDIEQLGKDTHGYVGADISQLCMEAALLCVKEELGNIDLDAEHVKQEVLDRLEITPDHFARALKLCSPSTLRESRVEIPTCSWEDVGGLEEVKRELHETVTYPVEHAEKYLKFGLKPSKGTLFFGPPGCGKTLLARAVANECGANFLSVKGPELLTMWFGESEANVRELFDKARAASPCILFFDEIDSIAKARGSGGGGGGEAVDRVINQILTEIDGVGVSKPVFVIGATNRPDILDPAITRPGRLDHLIYIPLPDYGSRVSIFKSCLRNSPIAQDVDLEAMANVTQGFSGADITEICQRASKFAISESIEEDLKREKLLAEGKIKSLAEIPDTIHEIESRHFAASMKLARRSVPDSLVAQYEAYVKSMALGSAQASSFKFSDEASDESKDSMYD